MKCPLTQTCSPQILTFSAELQGSNPPSERCVSHLRRQVTGIDGLCSDVSLEKPSAFHDVSADGYGRAGWSIRPNPVPPVGSQQFRWEPADEPWNRSFPEQPK